MLTSDLKYLTCPTSFPFPIFWDVHRVQVIQKKSAKSLKYIVFRIYLTVTLLICDKMWLFKFVLSAPWIKQ